MTASDTNRVTGGPWKIEDSGPQSQGEWHYWSIIGEHGVITSIGAANQRGPIDMESNEANVKFIVTAVNACFSVSPERPQAVAEETQEAFRLIEQAAVMGWFDHDSAAALLERVGIDTHGKG